RRGEEIGIVAGPSLTGVVGRLVAAAQTASPRPVTFLDRSLSFAGALTASDELASENATVLIAGGLEPENLGVMLDEVDRVVAVAGNAEEVERLGRVATAAEGRNLEIVLVSEEARDASRAWSLELFKHIVRECPRQQEFPLASADLAWIARHVTRTKLGVALGAGGAKGYAHVGVLQVLEEAGYTVDYVGGTSVGAMVGAWLALGMTAAEVEATMRSRFSPENVAEMFTLTFAGTSGGAELHRRMCRETTGEKSFGELKAPFVAMAVDLNTRQLAPIRDGPLWEGLVASTALAGLYPPFLRDGQRLV